MKISLPEKLKKPALIVAGICAAAELPVFLLAPGGGFAVSFKKL